MPYLQALFPAKYEVLAKGVHDRIKSAFKSMEAVLNTFLLLSESLLRLKAELYANRRDSRLWIGERP